MELYMHQLKYTSELSKATIFWWYKSIRSSLTKPYENKKFGYKHPKTPHISLTMPYKFFGFATVPLSFGGATVFHQTKPFEFYIIFSLSLSHFTSLSTSRWISTSRQIWSKLVGFDADLVLWRSCGFWAEPIWYCGGAVEDGHDEANQSRSRANSWVLMPIWCCGGTVGFEWL